MATHDASSTPSEQHALTQEFIAYEVSSSEGWSIRPAEARREWMTNMGNGFPYRCLPLVVSNQLGWVIGCPVGFEVSWNGQPGYKRTFTFHFDQDDSTHKENIKSHFGGGILTFRIPWLFRTPEGIGLQVRGPVNSFKAGIHPLEGFVETDWSPYTFTMNWRMDRPNFKVRFEKDEPICTLVPFPKDFLETFQPQIAPIDEAPGLKQQYEHWRCSRDEFIARLHRKPQEWQKHYLKGDEFGAHKPAAQILLRPFTEECE